MGEDELKRKSFPQKSRESGSAENWKLTVVTRIRRNISENPTKMIELYEILSYANKLECAEKSALHINLVGYL